ncbi:hypothetical protein E2C01_033531 [Portunus trituberculatus]|uniref:Uncharacterized protein n=1 Tax=Portunus trituberculatus TaxID=210409 RepID=A0A5B7F4B8_PORTR|nr:hypothetical protein [Portunus trituberculatus]
MCLLPSVACFSCSSPSTSPPRRAASQASAPQGDASPTVHTFVLIFSTVMFTLLASRCVLIVGKRTLPPGMLRCSLLKNKELTSGAAGGAGGAGYRRM